MEQLRQGIGLQAYGQRDPLVEYKMSGYEMFDAMTAGIREDTVKLLLHLKIEQKVEREEVAKVTGTNKDETGPPGRRKSGKTPRFIPTIRARAEAVRNTSSAAAESRFKEKIRKKGCDFAW